MFGVLRVRLALPFEVGGQALDRHLAGLQGHINGPERDTHGEDREDEQHFSDPWQPFHEPSLENLAQTQYKIGTTSRRDGRTGLIKQ